MQRYNLFQSAHNMLQDVLFDVAKSLQQTGHQPIDVAGLLLKKINEAIAACAAQVQVKEDYILPAIDPFEPAIVDAVKQRQQAAAKKAKSLQTLLTTNVDWAVCNNCFTGLWCCNWIVW
jgi:prolyl-tRNA synthetase